MWNEWGWMWPALTASALTAIALVPLGNRVLERGMVFADLAIAQWAALGILLVGTLFPAGGPALSLSGSLTLALLAVAMVSLVLRYLTRHREAMIGLLYALGACLATLLVSQDPHGAQRLAHTLNGDLLWTTPTVLAPMVLLALAVLVWQYVLPQSYRGWLFLPMFAIAITLTVDLAGIYVVFTSLIAAPLLLIHLRGTSIVFAILTCLAGHSLGLLISAWQDLPAGPTVVIAAMATCASAAVLARKPINRDAW
ncbi:hypothetical protein [Marinobacter excellens]|jgi:zinc/manganese transport system permease protein|uniref:Zinc ABC transporter, inner membrane permease protein ZnuB n=1 Tax=Marinobacter excellens LAMA 842 TaxID=1306954 RepID=A0A137SFX2_9GAMM|nr:hypothetical protein [Marinobacter excellens]KXO10647.1 Zinc ABC transporter, inner membrane permease protein ZnuB [Marinobacter excellens LAMA 842]KXO11312.1 Zinc ABC transporter, inner membrane permease protein ZnuB [Marinobacter excellens LAMA 842]